MRHAPVVLMVVALSGLSAAELHVAVDGDDAWSGTLPSAAADRKDGPFASLTAARDAARRLRKAGQPVTVHIHAGLHAVTSAFQLGAEDAGTAEAPAVWRAWRDEKPVLIGGRAITGWTPHRDGILKADVGAQGFKGIRFGMLVMDGKRQHLARYPNFDAANPYGGGWAYVDGKPIPMYQDVPDEKKNTLVFKESDARTWADPTEGEVFVFPRFNWWNNIERIASLDKASRTITLAKNASYPMRPGDRYHVRGFLEELDAPGEWHLDRKTWMLYFKPPGDPATAAVYAPTTRTIIEIGKGAAHIQLIGLTIECCDGTAVNIKDASDCLVAACTIRNAGDYHGSGVNVSGGFRNGVVGCDIHDIGSHGISLHGGDRVKLVAAGHFAENNYLHHFGDSYKQGVGISMGGCGNRASRNYIHDGPRMGIMFSGQNLVIEYNHIRHVNLETEDTGAVYTGGRDWIGSRGSVVRYNFFHDILGFGKNDKGKWVSPHFAWGVYLDDNTGGVDVIGNILVRCSRAGIHLHNGRDNWIENNIIADNGLRQVEYNGWTETSRMWLDHLPTMIKGYDSVIGEPAWKAMRNMEVHPTRAPQPDGTIMTGNRFVRNIVSYLDDKAGGFQFRNLPLAKYESDRNLVWHGGKPFSTGFFQVGKVLGDNLAVNPGFEEGDAGKPPKSWNWQECPAGTRAERVEEAGAGGRFCLRLDGHPGIAEGKNRAKMPVLVNADAPAKPGSWYRITARMKADREGLKAHLSGQSYIANVYFWAKEQACVVGREWKTFEICFKLPAPGEQGHHERMAALRARIDFRDSGTGVLWVDDVTLHEAEGLDEWQAWQAKGFDRASLVADPLFVAPGKDDWRLKPESPAFKLGFKPILVEKIGIYQDALRASWPIREAEGAREHPIIME